MPFISILSVAAFMLQWQSCVVAMETLWPPSLESLLFPPLQKKLRTLKLKKKKERLAKILDNFQGCKNQNENSQMYIYS